MTNPGSGQNTSGHQPDEIVVDLYYRNQVLAKLDDMGIKSARFDDTRSDETLNLGVITLGMSEDDLKEVANAQDTTGFNPTSPPRSTLDRILVALRHSFGKDNGQWWPEMGKNRTISGVEGAPHIGTGIPPNISGGASGYPEPIKTWALAAPTPGNGVRVGLIDTRLYPAPEFDGRIRYLDEPLLPRVGNGPYSQLGGHGTFSAGCILQQAPSAEIVVRGVLDGDARATVWDVATAMVKFRDSGISLLVLPLVCYTDDGEAPLALRRAVETLRNVFPIVAAAGNHGRSTNNPLFRYPAFPAACSGVIAVGAVNPNYEPSTFSPKGPWVEGAAPGEDVESTFLSGTVKYRDMEDTEIHVPSPDEREFYGYAKWSGTSFANATFAGKAASLVEPGRVDGFAAVKQLLRQADLRHHYGIGRYPGSV